MLLAKSNLQISKGGWGKERNSPLTLGERMGEYDAGQEDRDELAACHDDSKQKGSKGLNCVDDEELPCIHIKLPLLPVAGNCSS
jgi:hypothetical protein